MTHTPSLLAVDCKLTQSKIELLGAQSQSESNNKIELKIPLSTAGTNAKFTANVSTEWTLSAPTAPPKK
jgi:hypothetical protein